MKRLFLLRHAKSDWGDPGLDDFDRPLSRRGRNAAPRVAAWMHESDLVPELVLCSAARRTTETWELMTPVLGAIPTEHHGALYLASPGRILDLLAEQDDGVQSIMVIAHNPGTEELASRLTAGGDDRARERMRLKFPTAALAVISFGVDRWLDLSRAGGSLERFVRPADLD